MTRLPLALTASRLAIGLVLLLLIEHVPAAVLLPLVMVAALTDFLDGYLARRWKLSSEVGAALDLAADGVLFLACFVGFWRLGIWPGWLLLAVLASGVPEAIAQTVQLARAGRAGSPRRWWNRLVGGVGYACVLSVFAGLTPVAWGVVMAVVAWGANVADVVWVCRARPGA